MIELGLKISEMPAVTRLDGTHQIPVIRTTAPRNIRLPANAFQSRLWRPDILTLTGGAPDALDSLPTIGLLRERVDLYLADELQFWILVAGTAATNAAAGIVRPTDYAESTNEKYWIRVL